MREIRKIAAILAIVAVLLAFSAPAVAQISRFLASPTPVPKGMGTQDLMPVEQSNRDVMATLTGMKDTSTVVTMMKTAGMDRAMNQGSHTIFVPSMSAVMGKDISQFQLNAMANEPQTATKVVQGLTTNGMVMPGEMARSKTITMLNGKTMTVSSKNGVLMLDGSKITRAIQATNGMIYVMDSMPPQVMDIGALKK
jgi:uncharacterized surface protein with fasciclin (FAS1) repeats